VTLDLIQTVAFAGVLLFAGYGIKRLIPPLARYNIPAPVVGGLPAAIILAYLNSGDTKVIAFTETLRVPLQNAFFASVGFSASVVLLRRGGVQVLVMMILASVAAAMQNVIGAGVATALGQNPLLGVLAGSVTLTGGPATGQAFAPQFEAAGVVGAGTIALSAAMIGIVAGGLIGGPIGTYLLRRRVGRDAQRPDQRLANRLDAGSRSDAPDGTLANIAEAQAVEPVAAVPAGEDAESYVLLKHVVLLLLVIGVGAWLSAWIRDNVFNGVDRLPAYIGAMIVASLIRNLDDATGVVGISQRVIDDLGNVALSLFLVMALMTLQLLELFNVIGPLLIILAVQVAFIALLCLFVVPRLMGRDYDAVVMAGGFCGFMLGTTANAVANMGALVERYGPAPKAYLVVPLVGAFGIDFINALLIAGALAIWG
jgi:ESS family glutamate:Na+ symporter